MIAEKYCCHLCNEKHYARNMKKHRGLWYCQECWHLDIYPKTMRKRHE
jgi:ribosomal protein L37AE/L43A